MEYEFIDLTLLIPLALKGEGGDFRESEVLLLPALPLPLIRAGG